MEGRALVTLTLLLVAELSEVLSGLGDNVVVQLEVDTAGDRALMKESASILDGIGHNNRRGNLEGQSFACPATKQWEVTGLTRLRRQLVLDVEESGGELGGRHGGG